MSTTYADVTRALKFIIESGNVFYVDENGYVKSRGSNKIQQINAYNTTRDLVVFQEIVKDPNAMILNPFTEGVGVTEDQDWLYASTSTAFTFKVVDTCKFIAEVVLSQTGKNPEIDLPMGLVNFIHPYLKLVDKNTISDIDKITTNYQNFMSVFMKPKVKTAVFRCAVFEGPAFRDKFKVSKKTWTYLETVLTELFKLDSTKPDSDKLNELVYKTSVLGYPRFDATFRLYYKLYELTNPTFEIVEESPEEFKRNNLEYSVDISTLGVYIEQFDDYFKLTKNMIQPNTMPNVPHTQPVAPSGMPLPNNNLPINNLPKFGTAPTGSMPLPVRGVPAGMFRTSNVPMPSVHQSTMYSGIPNNTYNFNQTQPLLNQQPNFTQYGYPQQLGMMQGGVPCHQPTLSMPVKLF